MPIEIREVVVKAQLEKPLAGSQNKEVLSKELLLEMKEEIMAELMEKVEDKFDRILGR